MLKTIRDEDMESIKLMLKKYASLLIDIILIQIRKVEMKVNYEIKNIKLPMAMFCLLEA